jgi:hypothetical protein
VRPRQAASPYGFVRVATPIAGPSPTNVIVQLIMIVVDVAVPVMSNREIWPPFGMFVMLP